MIFNSPTVQKYIQSGARFVATIRKSGYHYINKRVVMKVGDKEFYGRVIAIEPIAPLTLSHYVKYSGFESVEEWMHEAERLHKAKIDSNKFEIVVIEASS